MSAQEYLKSYLMAVLERVEERKKRNGIVPSFTTSLEMHHELKEDMDMAIQSLTDDGKVRRDHTLNDFYIERLKA